MKVSRIAMAGALVILTACVALSQPTNNSPADAAADAAWKDVAQAIVLPATYNQQELQQHFVTAAAKAKAFYTQFPESTNAVIAKILECNMLEGAFAYGSRAPGDVAALTNALKALLADSRLTDDERVDARLAILSIERLEGENSTQDDLKRQDDYEKGLEALIKDYPKNDEGYAALLEFASEYASDDKARLIANEILADPVSDPIKDQAKAILNRLNAVGKPLNIKFTSLDGREVDLTNMKGKVVLVDFWATWCGPCVQEIPNIKDVYEKLHSKGFDVVGISFDQSEDRLKDFVQTNELAWPQYFDGKQWGNKFGQQYAINALPRMWLVDKKGNLADSNARDDLQGKVEKLLEEN